MNVKAAQPSVIDRILTIELARVTERAAVAAARLRGHGDEKAADQAAVDADMKTPLVQALVADLDELTEDGTAFRIERSSPVSE